jgi:glycosyltransferase involved in cell wall biosynthesis
MLSRTYFFWLRFCRKISSMRIVQLITRLIIGGAQQNVLLTCRGLLRRGHDVTLLTGPETGVEGAMFDVAQDYGIRVELVKNLRRNILPLKDVCAIPELIRALRRLKPDIVHTHSSKAGILGRFTARLAGVPVVIHTIHGLPFFRGQNTLVNRAYILAERLAATQADRIVAVAQAMVSQAVAAGVARPEKFTTVCAGFDTESFFPNPRRGASVRKELGIPSEAFVVGKVARLAPNKGHQFLLEALGPLMERHRNLWCLLVGDGLLRSAIETTIKQMGIDQRVRLAGLVSPARVPEMLWAMDMLVHASEHEGLPLVLVQGLLAGLPVVAFDLDGAREVIVPDKTGYLVKAGSVEQLAGAIEATITATGPVKPLSNQARARLAECFSWVPMVDRLEQLYSSLLQASGPGGR